MYKTLMRITQILIILCLMTPAFAFDFGIGDVVDKNVDKLLENIPDLNLGLDDEDPVTTSLDDAITEVPFLDDYEPTHFLPMGELPKGPGGSYLLMPGCYTITLESFCLHAGSYGPGGGDGYIYAPLKGKRAPIIRNILANSSKHPNIPQRDIQVLIWAILARTKISDMNPNMQSTAAQLLSAQEITELNGSALDVVKQELYGQAYGKLPANVRRVMEIKSELRSRLVSGVYTYTDLERIAVPVGDIPLDKNSRKIPSGRWSFHPDGYFIRFFPDGYSTTHIQVSVPDLCSVMRDASGNIVAIGDAWGNWFEIKNEAGSGVYTFTGPDPDSPADRISGSWAIPMSAPADTSKWMKLHEKEVRTLCGKGVTDISEILELGKLEHLVANAVSGNAGAMARLLIQQAWQDEVCDTLGVSDGSSLEGLVGMHLYGMGISPGGGFPGIFASGSLRPIIFASGHKLPTFDNLENMRRMRAEEKAWEEQARKNQERRKLKEFDPSGGTATPGNRGRQRLGLGSRPKDDPQNSGPGGKPNSYNQAKDAMNKFKYGITGAKTVAAPVAGPGAGAGMSGFAIPMALASFMVGKSTDMWNDSINALSGDPPDPNYDEIAEFELADYDHVTASAEIPQSRADAFNKLLDASMNLNAALKAATITIDRHGGALAAGDTEWILRQAEALVYYKRLSGVYMIYVADAILSMLDELKAEGIEDMEVTADNFRAYQDRLRAEGFSEDELNAARVVGLTDAQIQDSLNNILAADPDEVAGSVWDAWDLMSKALFSVGWDLYHHWDVVAPDDWDAGFLTLSISP